MKKITFQTEWTFSWIKEDVQNTWILQWLYNRQCLVNEDICYKTTTCISFSFLLRKLFIWIQHIITYLSHYLELVEYLCIVSEIFSLFLLFFYLFTLTNDTMFQALSISGNLLLLPWFHGIFKHGLYLLCTFYSWIIQIIKNRNKLFETFSNFV